MSKDKAKEFARMVAEHLKGDMKGYSKERKYLKKEIKEDQQLRKKAVARIKKK